jgi:hypothetical protein
MPALNPGCKSCVLVQTSCSAADEITRPCLPHCFICRFMESSNQGHQAIPSPIRAASAVGRNCRHGSETGGADVDTMQQAQSASRPKASHFWAAGFSFSPASLLTEVPYCPHLPHVFFGEEQYMLGRMYSQGWDVFCPGCVICGHQWERSARPVTYQACVQVDEQARQLGLNRVRTVLLGGGGGEGVVGHKGQQQQEHEEARQVQTREIEKGCVRRGTGQGPNAGSGTEYGTSFKPSAESAAPLAEPIEEDWDVGGRWGLGLVRSMHDYVHGSGVALVQQL